MKKIFLPILLVFFVMGCDKEQTMPDNPLNGISAKAKKGKVDVCHNGMIINVNGNAVSAHQEHGDAVDWDGDGYFEEMHWIGKIDDPFFGPFNVEILFQCGFQNARVKYSLKDVFECVGELTLESQSNNTYYYSEIINKGECFACEVEIELLEDAIGYKAYCQGYENSLDAILTVSKIQRK